MAAETSVAWNQGGEERIPRPFGRLWLLRRLARGGMGEVYLAATAGIEGAERPCVVKIIRRDHAADKSFVARFLDEARVQAQLQHHGVAQVLEASTDASGEPYVVVEFVEGRSLGEVRTRAIHAGVRVDWADAVAIGTSAAEALAHIHERTDATGRALGIVHRDLSPQNVMVGYGGDLKLIDFGTARGENRRCHTISGVVFAKPGYVAPEVASGVSGDFRVDLYALGVMLWELLAGRRFLQGEPNDHLALVAKGERKPQPIAALVGAPLELDDVIAKLTAHKVEDRYASAKLAASDLVKFLAKAPGLPNGERGVRARIASLMARLYPAEPAKSRAEFGSLVKAARWAAAETTKGQEAAAPAPESGVQAAAKSAAPEPAPSPPKSTPPRSEPCDGDMLPGTRYRLLRTIGRGAMGVVHEAEHLDLQRRVALKVMTQEDVSPGVLASFRREARAIARLSHPNLVMIHDFGEAEGRRAYCAMELLRGETLEQRIAREGRFAFSDAVAIGILACRGLEAAHAVGVVHCDLKPANLFLSTTGPFEDAEILGSLAGGLKILDFGIARTTHELGESPHAPQEFAIIGTPEYMAPEQAKSGTVDGRADVYALGCVLYELCTGRLPFVAGSPVGLVELKIKGSLESMRDRSRALGIPANLDRVVMKALAPRPDDRYASAADFRRALERVFAVPQKRRAASRSVGYACIGAAGLFAIAALGMARRHAPKPAGTSFATSLAAPQVSYASLPVVSPPVAPPPIALPAVATPAVATPLAQESPEPMPAPEATRPHERRQEKLVDLGSRPDASSVSATGVANGRRSRLTSVPTTMVPTAANTIKTMPLVSNASVSPAAARMTVLPQPIHVVRPVETKGLPSEPRSRDDERRHAALASALSAGTAALEKGSLGEALVIHRSLAKQHPLDKGVLRAWAESAAAARDWSEAIEASESWAGVDASVEPRLYLARMLAYSGRRPAAVRILENVIDAYPESDEARALFHDYRGDDHRKDEKPASAVRSPNEEPEPSR